MESASGGNAAGQLPFFIDYLHVSGLFDEWCRAVRYSGRVRMRQRKSTSWAQCYCRCCRPSALCPYQCLTRRCVNPGLLAMSKVVSEDSCGVVIAKYRKRRHPVVAREPSASLCACFERAVDFGCGDHSQDGLRPAGSAEIGYNPHKPDVRHTRTIPI